MTDTFRDAKLECFEPQNNSRYQEDYTVPSDDIREFDIIARAGDLRDNSHITLTNDKHKWSDTVDHGHRAELWIEPKDAEGVNTYGGGGYGDLQYGTVFRLRWTGMFRPYEIVGEGARSYALDITAEDFVFGLMGMRTTTGTYEEEQIVNIIHDVLSDACPEINRSDIPLDDDRRTSIEFYEQNVLDIVTELANRGDFILSADRNKLVMSHPSEVKGEFTANLNDHGQWRFGSNDDNLTNEVKLLGGRDNNLDKQQEEIVFYHSATRTDILSVQVPTRKSEIDEVELYTRRDSTDDINVRIQSDDGGEPVALHDHASDLANNRQDHRFISEDDWTTFELPTHTFAPAEYPWILVESSGENGHLIGVDASGDPAYRSYYPFHLNAVATDAASQDSYRQRETFKEEAGIGTQRAALDAARSTIARDSQPDRDIETEARSERFHALTPGDVITFELGPEQWHGNYVVVEHQRVYNGFNMVSDLTFREVESL